MIGNIALSYPVVTSMFFVATALGVVEAVRAVRLDLRSARKPRRRP